jgi:hypothetical protein
VTDDIKKCTVCEHEAEWTVIGGRFADAGKSLSCSVHISTVIHWLFQHPKMKDLPKEQLMVEVRPL